MIELYFDTDNTRLPALSDNLIPVHLYGPPAKNGQYVPVTGTIVAMAFGWLPVVLWVLVGGIFFGAVHDFGALYASMKNNGKSLAQLIEKYIGKTGRKLFLLFCWLFCGIVIAAFADMVAGTFNAYGTDGALVEAAQTNGAAGMVSIMFMVFAVVFGLLQKNPCR